MSFDDLGLAPELLRAMPLPQPAGSTDKNARGSVLVGAGSVEVPGAALQMQMRAQKPL